jgi:hypothetical protein
MYSVAIGWVPRAFGLFARPAPLPFSFNRHAFDLRLNLACEDGRPRRYFAADRYFLLRVDAGILSLRR